MRNWCAALVMSGLLALPLYAKEKSSGAGDDTTTAAANREKSAASGNSPGSNRSVAAKGVFALPATPRPTPFPGPAAAADTTAPGRIVPRYELSGMYDYLNFSPGDPFSNFSNHGAAGSFSYDAWRVLGLATEVGWYRFKNRNVGGSLINGTMQSYLFGPRLNWRNFDYFVPFAEFLFGSAHGGQAVIGTGTQNAFALATGGGVDMVLTKNLAWRVAQLDYFMTSYSGPALGASARQNSFRAGTGFVYRWGIPNPPPPPNHPPVAACSVSPASLFAGSGDSVAVHVTASDPDNDPLTYSYTATGGEVEGSGPNARCNSAGVAPGTYGVKCTVDDGHRGCARGAGHVEVNETPKHRAPATLSVERSPILPGEHTGVTCNGRSEEHTSELQSQSNLVCR